MCVCVCVCVCVWFTFWRCRCAWGIPAGCGVLQNHLEAILMHQNKDKQAKIIPDPQFYCSMKKNKEIFINRDHVFGVLAIWCCRCGLVTRLWARWQNVIEKVYLQMMLYFGCCFIISMTGQVICVESISASYRANALFWTQMIAQDYFSGVADVLGGSQLEMLCFKSTWKHHYCPKTTTNEQKNIPNLL